MDFDAIRTPSGIVVPPSALTWRFTRSSAPGGQHVNTSSTRVELRCDVSMVHTSEAIRERIIERLGEIVRVNSEEERSQRRNRERAVTRLCAMLDDATIVEAPRRPTRPTRGAVQRRLADKEHHSRRKSERRWRGSDDG